MVDSLGRILMTLPVILLALTLHELGHAWVAERCGDRTARMAGRVTLNPLAHIDVLGLILIIFAQFGWAKPVPVNVFHLRKPRRDMILVAAAGPAANLLLAIVAVLVLRFMPGGSTLHPFLFNQLGGVATLLYYSVVLNVNLMVFNLLPIPPLDGSRVLENMLPRRYLPTYEAFAVQASKAIFLIFMVSFLFKLDVFSPVLGPPVRAITSLLFRLAGY
ncbi:MAG: site-2 protease family protein [Nitrospirae bacterium]|nr:site-2 protease family protein [Nitrospirota bacterium]